MPDDLIPEFKKWRLFMIALLGVAVVAFAMAVIVLVQFQESKYLDDFDTKRHQIYVTAWTYIGFSIAATVLFSINGLQNTMEGKKSGGAFGTWLTRGDNLMPKYNVK